jgi:hypothetical protein
MMGWPFKKSGDGPVARRMRPCGATSITAWLLSTLGESSTRSASALPRQIRSDLKARELVSFPPS